MKRVLRTTIMAMLIIVLMVCMMAPAAMAAYESVYSEEVPVTIYMTAVEGGKDLPDSDEIPVTVTALTDGSPIVDNGFFTISCLESNGADGTTDYIQFGPFNKPGIHEYGVTIGTSSHKYSKDDEAVYYAVRVTVTNNDAYTGLETTVAIHLSDSDFTFDEKTEKIEDTNTYLSPLNITVVKRWASSNGFPVQMNLVKITEVTDSNGVTKEVEEIVETASVSKSTDWQHTFTDLEPWYKWEVHEKGVSGFYATYRLNDSDPYNWIYTITNHKALYQTGQLNWPIPVLVCFGSLFMLAGVTMLRKKEEPTNE